MLVKINKHDYKVNDNTIIKTIETIDNIISELNCLNGNKSYYDGLKFQTLLLSEKSQERNEKMCLITDSFKELKEFIEPNFLEKEIQEIQKLEEIKPISKLKINSTFFSTSTQKKFCFHPLKI